MIDNMNPFAGIDNHVVLEKGGNPWLASATYEEEDEYRFKGRKTDTDNILSMLQQNECVVCYAASGDGKSSLINAGLCPSMRRKGLFPIKITFSTEEYEGKGLPYISEDSNSIDFDKLIQNKIDQYINCYKRKFIDNHNINGNFEILFEKISKYENVNITNSLWWKFRTETIQMSFGEFDYLPVIIFDQFEEIFRSTWKTDFFRWLETLMKETCPHDIVAKKYVNDDDLPKKKLFRILFSMRYEYIGELDYWCSQIFYIPQLMRNRYYLRALNHFQAKQVIVEQSIGDEHALSIIRNKADDILSILANESKGRGINSLNEISAILLSILCFTYYNNIVTGNKMDLPSARDLVKTYYNNICDLIFVDSIKQSLPKIERALVSPDGTRERIRRKKVPDIDVVLYQNEGVEHTIGDLLLSSNILRKHVINDEEYIELAHDKIAEVIKEKIDNENVNEKHRRNRINNIENRRNLENVLTVSGRELFENQCYVGESGSERQSTLSTILHVTENDIRNQNGASESAYRTSIGELLKGTYHKKSMISMTIMSPDFQEHPFKDGVYYVTASLIESGCNRGRVAEVRFLDKQRNILFNRNGYCGINLSYDDCGNEISRIYVGDNQCPTYNIHCYAEIRREYDSYNMPIRTRYYSPEGIMCAHFEGNYGYNSEYDEDGNEIIRMYVGKDGEPCQLTNGIWGQQFDYNSDNQIIRVSNLNRDRKKITDDQGCVSAEYFYDENGYLIKERYCDKDLIPVDTDKGYSYLITHYNSAGLIESQDYYNAKDEPVMRSDGFFRIKIKYNENGWPVIVSYHDVDDNCVITEGAAMNEKVYDEIGLEKEIRLLGPDGAPMYNKDGVCIIKIEYNNRSKLPISYTYCNHKGEIALVNEDKICKLSKEWDDAGRYCICEKQYSKNVDVPSEILCYEWLSPFEYKVYSTNEKSYKYIKWNIFKRPIYEEDLNKQQTYHHKRMYYNDRGSLQRELYYNEDDTPCVNDMGDCGTEYLYDESGQVCGFASLGADGERHLNNDNWAVMKWEHKFQKNHVNKYNYYYDVDGKTPVLTKGGLHIKVEGDDDYWARYDQEGKLINNEYGVAKCKIHQDENEETFESEYYNAAGEPVEVEGIFKKRIRKSGFFSFSKYIVEYYDKSNRYADGPNPQNEELPKGCKFYLNKELRPYYGISKSRKVVCGNFLKEIINNILLTILLALTIVICLPFYYIVRVFKWIINKCHKDRSSIIRLVAINNVIDKEETSIANIARLFTNDVILTYGDWDYTDFNSEEDAINNFEMVFNKLNGVYKPITIGRIFEEIDSEPDITYFWVPGDVGVQLSDRVMKDKNGKVSELMNNYLALHKKQKNKKVANATAD